MSKFANRTSPEFCEQDADLTFISRDNVFFKVHSKYLVSAGGFPSPELARENEIFKLENSKTLTYLFSFLYPRRRPELKSVEFEVLYKLGEAAEKYEVFAAMAICKIRLEEFTRQKPLELFGYAYKYGYEDLLATTATLLVNKPLIYMIDYLLHGAHSNHVKIKFYEHWRKVILRTFTKTTRPGETKQCELCIGTLSSAMFNFYSNSHTWDSTEPLMESIGWAFQGRLHITPDMFKAEHQKNLAGVPTFDKFLRDKSLCHI